MKKLLPALLLLLLTSPISYEASAHNILQLDADAIGSNNNITIRQAETHSEMGVSAYFDLGAGDSNTIDIDMQGDSSGCCNYITGGFNTNSYSTLTIKMDGGTGNRAELDYDYTGMSTYHHLDINIDGASNAVYLDDQDVDHSNTSYEIDIDGDSNKIYPTIAGTQQAIKVYVVGDSNTIYTWTQGIGDLASGRTQLYSSADPSTYTLWISVTGSNNLIRARSTTDAKTKITLSGSGNHTISQFTIANGWMINNGAGGIVDLTIAGSSNNRIGYSGSYSGNIAIISLDASNQASASVDLWQTNGNNRFELAVTGSTIHQYTPYWIQQGDETYCATVNLNNLSASVSGAQSTGNDGGCS